jgi:nucleoside-diphosphate-sugar epimerase
MLIALTGGTGFIGRYLACHLAETGHRVRCWARPESDRSGFGTAASLLEWLPGQLGDPTASEVLVRGTDAVVHAAVDWDGPRDRRREREKRGDIQDFLDHNLMGSLRLFQAAYRAGVPRFVFISSCAVHEVILADRPLDETHPLWPTSHYGAHKAALEKFVHSYGLGFGWPICALRPTGVYGVDHPPARSRWFDLVGRVLRGEAISTATGGKEVHAADVARAVALLLQADAAQIAGQAFNCYDQYIAEQEVAAIARDLTGSASTIADLNRGPKNQISSDKLRRLGMSFGGKHLLRQTVAELIHAHRHPVSP